MGGGHASPGIIDLEYRSGKWNYQSSATLLGSTSCSSLQYPFDFNLNLHSYYTIIAGLLIVKSKQLDYILVHTRTIQRTVTSSSLSKPSRSGSSSTHFFRSTISSTFRRLMLKVSTRRLIDICLGDASCSGSFAKRKAAESYSAAFSTGSTVGRLLVAT